MAVKIYGIREDNKCREEVVSKAAYDKYNGDILKYLDRYVPKSWVQTMTATRQGFSKLNNLPDIYYFTENNIFGDEGCFYTVDFMIHDRGKMTYEPVPVVGSTAQAQQNNDACAYYRITKDEVQVELYVGINSAAYNILKSDSNKELEVICRYYA